MNQSLKCNYSEILNEKQFQAVQTLNGPVLIAAGPGSGKTRTIVYRTIYMIEQGIDPREILLITFTKKAANEMKERLAELLPDGNLPFIGTFHSLCLFILRNFSFKLGIEKNFKVYDPSDQVELIKNIIEGAKRKSILDLLNRISKLKNAFIGPSGAPFDLQEVYRNYDGAMREKNALDFDDLIVKTVKLLLKHEEVLEILPFKYLSVDEYQDTSSAQLKLIKLLAARDKNICAIGDSDQAIYAFRGANVENFLKFGEDFPEVKLINLDQNYRSTPQIVNSAEAVIEKNEDRMQRKLSSVKSEGKLISFCIADDEKAEAQYIVKTIDAKMGGVSRQSIENENIEESEELLRFSDFAVLYRTHLQGKVLEDKFAKEGIPYQIVGAIPFYDRTEIKDVLSYLRAIYDPNDEEAVKRVIKTFTKGIGITSIDKISDYARTTGIPFYQACLDIDTLSLTDEIKKALGDFIQKHESFRNAATMMNLSELIRNVLEEVSFFEIYKDKKRQDNVYELIGYSIQFDSFKSFEGLKAFIEETAFMQDKDIYDNKKNAVTLLTLHASKGLEFPIVFISGLEEELIPYKHNETEEINENEERRLFYVGMTRAEEELHLITCKERNWFGDKREMEVSRFAFDIPKSYIQEKFQERKIRKKRSYEAPDNQAALF